MSNVKHNFSIYPYDYNERLNEHASPENHTDTERRRHLLADELATDLGVIAIAAVTGIPGPEYREVRPATASPEQLRKRGAAPVRTMVTIDRPPFMTSLQLEQVASIDEQAILGRAPQQQYGLTA